ncbi:MAG: hypothetical protein PUB22_01075 [Clostridiales bacterium]|nr:hypothetical protein [Clostridiales bacterium]
MKRKRMGEAGMKRNKTNKNQGATFLSRKEKQIRSLVIYGLLVLLFPFMTGCAGEIRTKTLEIASLDKPKEEGNQAGLSVSHIYSYDYKVWFSEAQMDYLLSQGFTMEDFLAEERISYAGFMEDRVFLSYQSEKAFETKAIDMAYGFFDNLFSPLPILSSTEEKIWTSPDGSQRIILEYSDENTCCLKKQNAGDGGKDSQIIWQQSSDGGENYVGCWSNNGERFFFLEHTRELVSGSSEYDAAVFSDVEITEKTEKTKEVELPGIKLWMIDFSTVPNQMVLLEENQKWELGFFDQLCISEDGGEVILRNSYISDYWMYSGMDMVYYLREKEDGNWDASISSMGNGDVIYDCRHWIVNQGTIIGISGDKSALIRMKIGKEEVSYEDIKFDQIRTLALFHHDGQNCDYLYIACAQDIYRCEYRENESLGTPELIYKGEGEVVDISVQNGTGNLLIQYCNDSSYAEADMKLVLLEF